MRTRMESSAAIADRYVMFRKYFLKMEEGLLSGNVNQVSFDLDNILGAFGNTLQFKNFQQFDTFMLDTGSTLKL
ncbi:hypothetical protein AM500_05910 [Bacillus sp. FJAT-18017]|uniref:hypothetical protein n=1 Tax=Bacillus sp. FJAT-18017 TaxID=1705566 RepID=UPI0006AF194B|nr:hypothetical protein [Bacillus sp. FJAT-18017]ALC89369.1 hypothetical protein AM500_05910 [Bacillus sp. FJAT-18017]